MTSTTASRWPPPCWATPPGQVHADLGAAALADAAVGPGRPAGAQHHHHLLPQRHARRELPGHQLLRGPDLRVRTKAKVAKVADLADATICVAAGSTEEKNAADWFRERNLKVTIINFQKNDDAISATTKGRCDAYTAGIGALAGQRIKFKDPNEHQILTEVISNDPQGPTTRWATSAGSWSCAGC